MLDSVVVVEFAAVALSWTEVDALCQVKRDYLLEGRISCCGKESRGAGDGRKSSDKLQGKEGEKNDWFVRNYFESA